LAANVSQAGYLQPYMPAATMDALFESIKPQAVGDADISRRNSSYRICSHVNLTNNMLCTANARSMPCRPEEMLPDTRQAAHHAAHVTPEKFPQLSIPLW